MMTKNCRPAARCVCVFTVVAYLRQCGHNSGGNLAGPNVVVAPDAKLVGRVGQQMVNLHVSLCDFGSGKGNVICGNACEAV